MGHYVWFEPVPPFFSARMFLKEAKRQLDEVKDLVKDFFEKYDPLRLKEEYEDFFSEQSTKILSKLFLGKISIVRALRVNFFLSPDSEDLSYKQLFEELREKMSLNEKLKKLYVNLEFYLFRNISIKYSVRSPWGIPRYSFTFCEGKYQKVKKNELLIQAIKERLNNLEHAIELAKEIIFFSYIQSKEYEFEILATNIDYEEYFSDYLEDIEWVKDILKEKGIELSKKEILAKIEQGNLYHEFQEIFDEEFNKIYEEQTEDFINSLKDEFWKFKEEDSIFYGHADF